MLEVYDNVLKNDSKDQTSLRALLNKQENRIRT